MLLIIGLQIVSSQIQAQIVHDIMFKSVWSIYEEPHTFSVYKVVSFTCQSKSRDHFQDAGFGVFSSESNLACSKFLRSHSARQAHLNFKSY